MKRIYPALWCLALLLLAGCAGVTAEEAQVTATPLPSDTPYMIVLDGTPEPEPTATPEPTTEPIDHIGQRARDNMLMELSTLKLVGFKAAITLYSEASEEGESSKLINKTTDRAVSELIVLSEKTSAEGELFYQVRSAFSQDTGYVLAEDTFESTLAAGGVSGYALMQCANCSILKSPDEESTLLAQESYHAARILGSYKDYDYVLTEDGNLGYVKPDQLKQIDDATLEAYLASGSSPAAGDRFDIEDLISYANRQTSATTTEDLIFDGLSRMGVYFNPGYYQFYHKELSDLTQYPIGYQADVYNSTLFQLWNSAGNLAYYNDQPMQWDYVPTNGSLERGDLLFFAEYGAGDTVEVEKYLVVLRGPDSGYLTACGIYLGNDQMLWVKDGVVTTVDQVTSSPIWAYFDSARRIHPEVTDVKAHLIECMITSMYDRLGTPYNNFCRMGETSYDCSGIVGWAFRRAGATQLKGNLQFRETTASGLAHLEAIYYDDKLLKFDYVAKSSRDQTTIPSLERGDLIFLLGESHARISHVMLYLGDMRVIHSTTVTDFYRGTLIAGFREELQGLYTNAIRIVSVE